MDWRRAVVREIAEIHSHNAIPRRRLPKLLTRLRTALGVSTIRWLSSPFVAMRWRRQIQRYNGIGRQKPVFASLPLAYPINGGASGKQKRPRRAIFNALIFLRKFGAGEGIRTLDPNLGKVVLYP